MPLWWHSAEVVVLWCTENQFDKYSCGLHDGLHTKAFFLTITIFLHSLSEVKQKSKTSHAKKARKEERRVCSSNIFRKM